MPSAASLSGCAFECESPELASPKRRAAEVSVALPFQPVDEVLKRRPAAEAEALDVEGRERQRAEPGLPPRPLEVLMDAVPRRQQAVHPRAVPDPVQPGTGHRCVPPPPQEPS